MRQDETNPYLWYAEEGKLIMQKNNKEIVGDGLSLSDNDSIDNYTEIDNPDWSATEAEMDNAALLKFINDKTGGNYKELGDAVIELINKSNN